MFYTEITIKHKRKEEEEKTTQTASFLCSWFVLVVYTERICAVLKNSYLEKHLKISFGYFPIHLFAKPCFDLHTIYGFCLEITVTHTLAKIYINHLLDGQKI